jgi:sec-independent protein translocase protein TatB
VGVGRDRAGVHMGRPAVFSSLGWGEIFVLGMLALIIFGPERLPGLAKDAAKALKQLRETAQGARSQLKSELGPEFADVDLDSLNPKTFVRKHLLEGLDDDPFSDDPTSTESSRPVITQKPLAQGEAAPYDVDAT